jgi:hypothetical protein
MFRRDPTFPTPGDGPLAHDSTARTGTLARSRRAWLDTRAWSRLAPDRLLLGVAALLFVFVAAVVALGLWALSPWAETGRDSIPAPTPAPQKE